MHVCERVKNNKQEAVARVSHKEREREGQKERKSQRIKSIKCCTGQFWIRLTFLSFL